MRCKSQLKILHQTIYAYIGTTPYNKNNKVDVQSIIGEAFSRASVKI